MQAETQRHFTSCLRRRELCNAKNDSQLEYDLFTNNFDKVQAEGIYNANEFGLSYHFQISLCTTKVNVAVVESIAR